MQLANLALFFFINCPSLAFKPKSFVRVYWILIFYESICCLFFLRTVAGYFELKTSNRCLVKTRGNKKDVICDLMTDLGLMHNPLAGDPKSSM